jgi:hypothetical protein
LNAEGFLEDEITGLRCGEHEVNIRSALRGILLRIELPQLNVRIGLNKRVLYTDCDVFFRGEIATELASIHCKYFAVAPEFDREDYYQMNTVVMWMNLPMLRTVDADFRAFVRQNLPRLQRVAWDQGAYRQFFARTENAIQWDKLRPELHWKPYWGDYADAKLIHFHGPKLFHRPHIDSHFAELKHLTGGCYDELCALWEELLAEAE